MIYKVGDRVWVQKSNVLASGRYEKVTRVGTKWVYFGAFDDKFCPKTGQTHNNDIVFPSKEAATEDLDRQSEWMRFRQFIDRIWRLPNDIDIEEIRSLKKKLERK